MPDPPKEWPAGVLTAPTTNKVKTTNLKKDNQKAKQKDQTKLQVKQKDQTKLQVKQKDPKSLKVKQKGQSSLKVKQKGQHSHASSTVATKGEKVKAKIKGKKVKTKKDVKAKEKLIKHHIDSVKVKAKHVKKLSPEKHADLQSRRLLADSYDGIRVGTDFSGWDTPVMSLRKLSIRHLHVFSCEKDPHLRALIRQNSKPLKIYKNSVPRGPGMTLPCDLYVAGPPCQPWSTAGLSGGLEDVKGRGTMLWLSLNYIGMEKPKVVVIENVWGLLRNHRATFDMFVTDLKDKGYTVLWECLNTLDHGLPQNRPRVYIVGFRSDLKVETFEFPPPLAVRIPVGRLLSSPDVNPPFVPKAHSNAKRRIREALRAVTGQGIDADVTPVFVDTGASKKFAHFAVNHCPCLTFSRCSQGGHYVTSLKRKLTLKDCHGQQVSVMGSRW